MSNQKIIEIKVSDLHLWTENPRDPIEIESTDFDIINRAISNNGNKWNLQSLISKMGNYYDLSELPTVVKIDHKYVVYDGNRRIAILKYLQNEELYTQLNGGLYFNEEPKELRELKVIPCNVCNIETALTNIERKHVDNGNWTKLERDYFIHKHLNKDKSHFIRLDEQTGIISNNPKLNQRFVKDEILTISNLAEIGFAYNNQNGFVSNYDENTSKKIINNIVELIEKGIVSTRGEFRKQLKGPLLSTYPELKGTINKFNPQKTTKALNYPNDLKNKISIVRKTPISKENDVLFGKNLSLQDGKVNDLYRAIFNIYDKNKNDNSILPILGMSMRLITEVAARVYFEKHLPDKSDRDQLYRDFLKIAKKEMNINQSTSNHISIINEWLDGNNNLEAILGKYAHGNIIVDKGGILKTSIIVGEILEHYFKR
jgi:hypothetical protein